MNIDDAVDFMFGWLKPLWDAYGWRLIIFPTLALLGYMMFKGDL